MANKLAADAVNSLFQKNYRGMKMKYLYWRLIPLTLEFSSLLAMMEMS